MAKQVVKAATSNPIKDLMRPIKLLTGKPKGTSSELTAAQREQLDAANKRDAELTAQEEARRRAIAGRAMGRPLLMSGGDAGLLGG